MRVPRDDSPLPRVMLVSIPKAGTHMIAKAVSLLPGFTHAGLHVDPARLSRFPGGAAYADPQRTGIWGVNLIRWPDQRRPFRHLLDSLRAGQFITSHLAWNEPHHSLLADLGYRVVFLTRDPRAVAASHSRYVTETPEHPLHSYFAKLEPAARLRISITGATAAETGTRPLTSVVGAFRSRRGWTTAPGVLTLRYEELVGPRGGGTVEHQETAFLRLGAHLGLDLDRAQLDHAAQALYGGTATFNKGRIDAWRDDFTPAHEELFKRETGDLLVSLGYERDASW